MTLPTGLAAGAGVLVAAGVAALLSWASLRTGPVDVVGGRTSHSRPTPTSGGLAILAGVALGIAAYALSAPDRRGLDQVGLVLFFASLVGAGGALDDMIDLDARGRLLISVAIAFVFAMLAGPVQRLPLAGGVSLDLPFVVGLCGAALWIVTASNAVNFMDGANGFASGGLSVSFLALAVAAFGHGATPIAAAALCGAAANAGFLPFNLKGRLFQGDVGALFSAFYFAALCLVAAGPDARGPVGVYFGPIALIPYLTDVLLTLARRASERKSLFSAHREHLYQRWLQAGRRDHAELAWRGAALMALSGALAVAGSFTTEAGQAGALLLAIVLGVLGWRWIDRRLR